MTNLSNSQPQDELSTSPTTTIIESLGELAGAIAASSACPNMASSPPRSTSSSSSSFERPNVNRGPGVMYEAPLNDEINDSSEEDQQQAEGNKRRRERRRSRRSALSVECHPFFNGQYLAFLEDQVHKKQADAQDENKNQENVPQTMCPPTLIAEKTFDNAHAWNDLHHVRRARRRTSRTKAATSA